MLGTEIALEDAIDIATKLGETDALSELSAYTDETVFKLTIGEYRG